MFLIMAAVAGVLALVSLEFFRKLRYHVYFKRYGVKYGNKDYHYQQATTHDDT